MFADFTAQLALLILTALGYGSYPRQAVMPSTLLDPPEWSNEAFQFALLQHLRGLFPAERALFARGSAEEVLDLAVRWDAEHQRRSRSRRWASVFHNVAKSVEGFFKVISTTVQARPEIAAFVWGGIRFIIEVSLTTWCLLIARMIVMSDG